MKKIFPVILVLLCVQLSAQKLPQTYNQFFMNPYIYNPAYAGVEGHTVLFFMYKNHWSQVQGAPTEMHANFHVPLKGGLALGAMAFNEKTGPLTTSAGKVTAGYLFTLDREHFFRFGMSIGGGNTMLDQETFVEAGNDPTIAGIASSGSFLMGDLGVTYHFGHFNIGVSLPHLFDYSYPLESGLAPIAFKPTDNIMFKTNFRGHVNDDIAIEPHIIYRYNKYLPDQYEATVILHIYHLVWVGGTYRQDAGFIGLLGAKIKEKFGIGYSYEFGNASYANQLGTSHEIHIGYHLGSKKEHAEHVSSFIKSHRLSAEQRAKEAELERQRELQALRENRAKTEPKPDEDALGILGAPVVSEVKEKPKNTWNYEREETLLERVNEYGEVEKGIKFDRINENGEKEVVFSWLPPPPPGATSETYEIANPEEPPLERTRPDGTKEVGVKWVRTIDGGEKEILIVWDPVLTEAQAAEIDHSPSQTMGLGAAHIVINSVPATVPPVETAPVETEVEQPKIEQPVVEQPIEEPEPIIEEPAPQELPEPEPVVTETKPEPEVRPELEKEIKVTRTGHMLEFPVGNYVIAGAFESLDHAEDLSDKLFERGFHDTRVYYRTERGYYYVSIYESDNAGTANKQRNKFKELPGLSEVWVLKVNE